MKGLVVRVLEGLRHNLRAWAGSGAALLLAGSVGIGALGLAGCAPEGAAPEAGTGSAPIAPAQDAGSAIADASVPGVGDDAAQSDGEVPTGVRADLASDSWHDAVAAYVAGEPIYEGEVNAYIAAARASSGLETDDDWAAMLAHSGVTVEQVRADAINSIVQNMLMERAIVDEGIEVTDDEVQQRLAELRDYYDGGYGEGGWEMMRSSSGFASDEQFARHLVQNMRLERLQEKVVGEIDVDDAAVQAYLDEHVEEFAGKRSSYLVVASEEDAAAVKSIVDQGWLTFPQAAGTYSLAFNNAYTTAYGIRPGSQTVAATQQDAQADYERFAAQLGEGRDAELEERIDFGWTPQAAMDSVRTVNAEDAAYEVALDGLAVGEVSDPVAIYSEYVLVCCTDSYDPSIDGSRLEDMPEDLQERAREATLKESRDTAWTAYGERLRVDAEVTVLPMPSGLPYDVSAR